MATQHAEHAVLPGLTFPAARKVGFSTHEAFDALVLVAEGLGDREHTLQQLAALMQRCVACHAAYTVLPPAGTEPDR